MTRLRDATDFTWAELDGKPSTISGFGITDAAMLIAQAHLSAAQTVNHGTVAIINFNSVDYDPLGIITTGASWHATLAATGRYLVVLTEGFIDPNGSAYAASSGVEIDLYKNTSTFIATLDYEDADGTAATDHWLFLNGSKAASLTAGDTITIKLSNFSGAARKLGTGAGIEIYRVK